LWVNQTSELTNKTTTQKQKGKIMKVTGTLKIAVLSLVTTFSIAVGNCQTYQLSGTIPDFSLLIYDTGNSSFSMENIPVDGARYNETVTIDAAASTIEDVGSVSIPSTVSNVLDTARYIITTNVTAGEFPNCA
jgi:hypothetical protein